jgi:hypothetical protein
VLVLLVLVLLNRPHTICTASPFRSCLFHTSFLRTQQEQEQEQDKNKNKNENKNKYKNKNKQEK